MQENIIVSSRGQITLPATLRKRLGIKPGDVIIMEDRNGEIILKPAAVLEIELYTDVQIERWDEEDRLESSERERILRKLNKRK
ncbi:MAG: AbrB/MazE/SpoVT family DNA-binding domain-containing protein [Gammaproteobacteria bacterium]|nr:AbrB/MazE/SpoVT family DNA-binding domain-containing protein [Gammaproteobacteria bacterium]